MLSDARIRPLVRLLYVAAVVIVFNQGFELLARMGQVPIQPRSAAWRFRFLNVLASRAGWMIVIDALLFSAVIRLEDRRGLRLMGWLNLVLAAGAFLCLPVLARDGLTLRNTVPGHSIDLGVVLAGVPLALFTVIALLAGWTSVRRSRRPDWSGRKRPMTPLFTDTAPGISPRRGEEE